MFRKTIELGCKTHLKTVLSDFSFYHCCYNKVLSLPPASESLMGLGSSGTCRQDQELEGGSGVLMSVSSQVRLEHEDLSPFEQPPPEFLGLQSLSS